MATPEVSAKSFFKSLMDISLGIVWKDPFYAIAQEPDNQRIDAETYVAARNGILNFNSVFQFHEAVLAPFFSDKLELERVTINKRLIPNDLRDNIVEAEAAYMIDWWENKDGERNEYYRRLFGLPPIDTPPGEFLYNTKHKDLDMETPLHLMNYTQRLKLENRGYFDELLAMEENKDKEYIKYLGKKRILPYIARDAQYYQLIYCPRSSYENLREDFMDVYEQARRMVLRVYYNDAYRNQSHLYEGFLGMLILFITQQRMCIKYLEADIPRDFYDLESLKMVYDAYGVPFYSSIPLKYHERVVKHLNELIAYKGSTQVFYDIFGLFDFGSMDVFEYYLVKERVVDNNGNPIFRDENGKKLTNYEKFRRRFARVNWKENKFVQITDVEKKVPYEQLTEPDPYWIEDIQLQEKMYGMDWNYFQSKYMGVQIMFEVSQLIFETCYFFHMLEDNRNSLSAVTTYYTMTGEDIPIYDLVIYALAILCKNAGYAGEIPTDPASIAAIYGFNFKEINQLLKMATDPMNDFIIEFKKQLRGLVEKNEILKYDRMITFLIDQITDGAFNWLGNDFPYGTWGHAPFPVFLHDFTPTANSVENLRRYLRDTIDVLKDDESLTDFEIVQLYQRLASNDNYVFTVVSYDSTDLSIKHSHYIVKSYPFDDEDLKNLRNAIIASYESLFSYMIRLLDARTALTFDPKIIEMISTMNVDSVEDVDRVYRQMKDLDEYLTLKIRTSHSKVDYEAYANCRKILMTTHLMQETFTKSDGKIAKTYEDLLSDINPQLYQRFISDDFDAMNEESYVIQTLMRLCDEITLLESINTTNIQRIVEYMFKIIRFFKSVKVDLVDFNIIYLINGRTMNYIKLLGEIWAQHVEGELPPDYLYLSSEIWAQDIKSWLREELWLKDLLGCDIWMDIDDSFELIDKIFIEIYWKIKESFEYFFDWQHKSIIRSPLMEPVPLICLDGHAYSKVDNLLYLPMDMRTIMPLITDRFWFVVSGEDAWLHDYNLFLTDEEGTRRTAEVFDDWNRRSYFLLTDEEGTRRSAEVFDDWNRRSYFFLDDIKFHGWFPVEMEQVIQSAFRLWSRIYQTEITGTWLNGSRFLLTDENGTRLSSEVVDDSWPRQSRYMLTTDYHGHFPVHVEQTIKSLFGLWCRIYTYQTKEVWLGSRFLLTDENGKRLSSEVVEDKPFKSIFTLLDENGKRHSFDMTDAFTAILNMMPRIGDIVVSAPEVNDAIAMEDTLIKVSETILPPED